MILDNDPDLTIRPTRQAWLTYYEALLKMHDMAVYAHGLSPIGEREGFVAIEIWLRCERDRAAFELDAPLEDN